MKRIIVIDTRPELVAYLEDLEERLLPPVHPRSARVRLFCLLGLALHVVVWVGSMILIEELRLEKMRRVLGGHEGTLRVIEEIVSRESK